MLAAEAQEGLFRLSVEHHTTLSRTPEQNGKQEVFFSQIEGRLMAMLEGEPQLTLELLNRATQAWAEEEYQRHLHSETKQSPLDRFRTGPSVGRPCPSSDQWRRAFRTEMSRKQRTSDGTITVAGVRYEIPSAYRLTSKSNKNQRSRSHEHQTAIPVWPEIQPLPPRHSRRSLARHPHRRRFSPTRRDGHR
jgi:hypothetical protein